MTDEDDDTWAWFYGPEHDELVSSLYGSLVALLLCIGIVLVAELATC